MTNLIKVENLGKKYLITHQGQKQNDTLRDVIASGAKRLTKIGKYTRSRVEEFWALRNVSFYVNQGDRLGIIGRNGSGKTTLLKILSRITVPSEGIIGIKGKVSSLLEVGTGFHPELTGGENIFLNGAILGMSRKEIKRRFDEIVEFAEVEKFIDTPVKRYSSGMYVRLAFAVAAHLDTEILLVDEVLAVGDIQFQKKCINKMDNISTQEGRTILFVSHNLGVVKRLCNRCLWIDSGKLVMDDCSGKVVDDYLNTSKNLEGLVIWNSEVAHPGDKEYIQVNSLRIINPGGLNTGTLFAEEPFWIEIGYEILKFLPLSQIGIRLNSASGEIVFQSGDIDLSNPEVFSRKPGNYISRCKIPAYLLNEGIYSISLYGHIPNSKILISEEQVISFEIVLGNPTDGYGKQPGTIKPMLLWEINIID